MTLEDFRSVGWDVVDASLSSLPPSLPPSFLFPSLTSVSTSKRTSSVKIKSLSRFSWDFFACVLIASSRSYKAPARKLRGRPSDMPL